MNYKDIEVDANVVVRQLSARVGELETQVMLKSAQIDVLAQLLTEKDAILESLQERSTENEAVQD